MLIAQTTLIDSQDRHRRTAAKKEAACVSKKVNLALYVLHSKWRQDERFSLLVCEYIPNINDFPSACVLSDLGKWVLK